MKSKIKIIIPVVLIALGGTYKFALAKPPAEPPKPKIAGTVHVLPKDFLVNLSGGRFAKLQVALVMAYDPHHGGGHGGGHGPAPKVPEGYGSEPQEAVVRGIITEHLTGAEADELMTKKGRKSLKKHILHDIHHKTDVHAEDIVFTDIAVQ